MKIASSIKPSARGELEITDVHRVYTERGDLHVAILGRGFAGSHALLVEASHFVQVLKQRQDLRIACPEEIALRLGYIFLEAFRNFASDTRRAAMASTCYRSMIRLPMRAVALSSVPVVLSKAAIFVTEEPASSAAEFDACWNVAMRQSSTLTTSRTRENVAARERCSDIRTRPALTRFGPRASVWLAERRPFVKTTPYAPNSPYAMVRGLRAADRDHRLEQLGSCHFSEKLIPHMFIRGLADQPLPVYGDGQNVRDWLYVGDHAEALIRVIQRGRLGHPYNLRGRRQRTNL